jgi:hypothetical protein
MPYRGNHFTMDQPASWTDETVYLLRGPVDDGMQHSITVTCDRDPQADDLDAYADPRVREAVNALQDATVLMDDTITLDSGHDARRYILRWRVDQRELYQQNLCLLAGNMGFILSASFTADSRKTVGPEVDAVMRSFTPNGVPQ